MWKDVMLCYYYFIPQFFLASVQAQEAINSIQGLSSALLVVDE